MATTNPWEVQTPKMQSPEVPNLNRVAEILRKAPDQRDRAELDRQAQMIEQTIVAVQEQEIDYEEVERFYEYQARTLGIEDWLKANR